MKSGGLNFLETSWLGQACNGIALLVTKHNSCEHIKKNEMGGEKKCICGGEEKSERRSSLGKLGVDGNTILKFIFKK